MAADTFLKIRLKIGSFSGDFHLKIYVQFMILKATLAKVAGILNARIPDFPKV